MLKPVNGSVPCGSPATDAEEDDVATVLEGEVVPELVAVLVLEVELTEVGAEVEVELEELEWWELALSGSTYCWSPAEGPPASAATGAASATPDTRTRQVRSFSQRVTLRVLQAMRLFAFSDLHRDRDQARRIVEVSRDADVVIGAGDFASFHLGLGGVIDILSEITAPTIVVPGNNERDNALWRACGGWTAATMLHGAGTEIDGVQFFGLGAGVPNTPFPWSFDLSEEDAEEKLRECPEGAILVLHSPPKGYVDEAHGRSLGSTAILRAIERVRPPLAVCGHIHDSWGREARIGETRVVNLGPEGKWFEV
jgi:Icc-related predicted phosphoesterase